MPYNPDYYCCFSSVVWLCLTLGHHMGCSTPCFLVLYHLLLPSIVPSIRVFSNESALRIRWPKDWSFSFNTMITFYLDKFFFWLYHTSCRVLIPQLRTEPVSSLEVLNSKLCTTRDGFSHILSSNILGGLRVEDLNMRSPLFFNF